MKTTHDLFNLIKALDKNEKRYFKLFATLYGGEKNYIRLYEAIDNQAEYDEKKLRDVFRNEPFLNQLSVAKNYLYNLVLKSLEVYHTTIDSEFRSLISQVEILFNKDLYNECRKHLVKAKKIAVKYDNHIQIIEVLHWEIQLLPNEDAKKRIDISDQVITLLDKLKRIQDYRILNNKMFNIFNVPGDEIINTENPTAFLNKSVAQMTSQKSSTTCNDCNIFLFRHRFKF